jgi:hypothetical protein
MKVKARVSKASDEVSGAGTPCVRIDLLLESWIPVKTNIHFDSAVFLLSLRAECLLALLNQCPATSLESLLSTTTALRRWFAMG